MRNLGWRDIFRLRLTFAICWLAGWLLPEPLAASSAAGRLCLLLIVAACLGRDRRLLTEAFQARHELLHAPTQRDSAPPLRLWAIHRRPTAICISFTMLVRYGK